MERDRELLGGYHLVRREVTCFQCWNRGTSEKQKRHGGKTGDDYRQGQHLFSKSPALDRGGAAGEAQSQECRFLERQEQPLARAWLLLCMVWQLH